MKPIELKRGIRLTCPMCGDSSIFTPEEIEAAGGSVNCGNHISWVTMVNLVDLLGIWGRAYEPLEEVEFEDLEVNIEEVEEVEF